MAADRRERAKSIRAARDWLTGAENALVGEDDLAGDLKLMLARAELARLAADRHTRLRRVLRRLLLPLAATGVLVWMLWGVPHTEETVAAPPVQRAERHDVPAPAAERTEDAASIAVPSGVMSPAAEPQTATEEDVPQTGMPTVPPVSVREEAAPQTASARHPQMPTADMQRLMQVGGKILRE